MKSSANTCEDGIESHMVLVGVPDMGIRPEHVANDDDMSMSKDLCSKVILVLALFSAD